MTWYSTRLLYEFVDEPQAARPQPLFEESLIVFKATRSESPIDRLVQFARNNEHDYDAAAGNHVYYTFREVLEVQDIGNKITDGTEVFYRFWHSPGPRAFKAMRATQTYDWWSEEGQAP